MFIAIVSRRFREDEPVLPQCVWMNRPTDNKEDRLTLEK
jgi:hypothetical protein